MKFFKDNDKELNQKSNILRNPLVNQKNISFQFICPKNPIKLSKIKNNPSLNSRVKNDELFPNIQSREISSLNSMNNEEGLKKMIQSKYMNKRKRIYIKTKVNLSKLSKNYKNSPYKNHQFHKFIPLIGPVESQIEFSKIQIDIPPILDKTFTNTNKNNNDIIYCNNKLSRNLNNNVECTPIGNNFIRERNFFLKKYLNQSTLAIYESLVTNNPSIMSNLKRKLSEEKADYLIFSIEKIYKNCYSLKDKLNIEDIRVLMFKEFNLKYTIFSDKKDKFAKTNHSRTILHTDSINERYQFNTNRVNFLNLTKFFSSKNENSENTQFHSLDYLNQNINDFVLKGINSLQGDKSNKYESRNNNFAG